MPTIEAKKMLAVAAEAADANKAEDVRILQLDPSESGLADYFLICSGNSDRQNTAIVDEIEIQLKRQFGQYPRSVEGRRQGEWILMDYVDFIVHVFTHEKRAFYSLERLRKTATSLSLSELEAEIRGKSATKVAKKNAPAKKAVVKKAVVKKTAVKKTVAKKASPAKGLMAVGKKVAKKSAKKYSGPTGA